MGEQVGIDIGTTWTAAAVHRGGRVEIVSLGDRTPTIPSVVFLREDGVVLTWDAANRRALTEPGRVAREFKRRVGDPTPVVLGGVPYPVELVMAKLLRWVVDKVTEVEGMPPDAIALTHPASWGRFKQDLLRQSVRHAGIDPAIVTLLTEPEAAAMYYAAQERVPDGAVIAVYDLGGGTFDTAVLRKRSGGDFEILGEPEGIERTGGVDFDAVVFGHVNAALDNALDALDLDDDAAIASVARVRQECVDAKEVLSADTDVSIPVALPRVHHDVRLTRAEFETMIRPLIVETIDAMRRALASAGVEPNEVHAVLLVGGSSRIPLVGQMVSAAFGRPVAVDAHPKHAVALGAAMAAAASAGVADTGSITPVVGDREPPVTASVPVVDLFANDPPPAAERVPIVMAPPPPPPSAATRRIIVPEQPPADMQAAVPPRRGRRAVVATAVALALVAAVAVVLVARRDGGSSASTASEPPAAPASSDPANLQPGPPPGSAEPATPTSPPAMVALRHGAHTGFERVAIDFADTLPPSVQNVEVDAAQGRVRIVLGAPRPTQATGAARLDVDAPLVRSVFYVVDANRTFVDVFTKQVVDPLAFRLGNVAFKDGSVKGMVVVDLVPRSNQQACCDRAAVGSGGAIESSREGATLHVEGYGVRASGKGVLRLLDGGGAEVRRFTVGLTAAAPANGVFRSDIDVAGLARGNYTIAFSSDDARDAVDGQPPLTTQVVAIG